MDNESGEESNSENENDDEEDMSPDFRSKTHLVITNSLLISFIGNEAIRLEDHRKLCERAY